MSDTRSNVRRASFGSLTAGMIVRGAVPAQILFAGAPPPAPLPKPASAPPPVAALPPVAVIAPAPVAVPAAAPIVQPTAPLTLVAACEKPARKAMTVRLEPAQHLRLRVLSAYERRSAQDIMVRALASYLDRHGLDAAAD